MSGEKLQKIEGKAETYSQSRSGEENKNNAIFENWRSRAKQTTRAERGISNTTFLCQAFLEKPSRNTKLNIHHFCHNHRKPQNSTFGRLALKATKFWKNTKNTCVRHKVRCIKATLLDSPPPKKNTLPNNP